LLWRSLSKGTEITLDAVGDMITPHNVNELTAIVKALGAPEKNSKRAKADE